MCIPERVMPISEAVDPCTEFSPYTLPHCPRVIYPPAHRSFPQFQIHCPREHHACLVRFITQVAHGAFSDAPPFLELAHCWQFTMLSRDLATTPVRLYLSTGNFNESLTAV